MAESSGDRGSWGALFPVWPWRCQSGSWMVNQGSFPHRRGDSRDNLAPQPTEPARLGAVLAATAGSAGLSHCGRAGLFQNNGHCHCPDMGMSVLCHLRGTSFEAIMGAGHPGSSPDAPDGLGMPKALAQLPCRLLSPLPHLAPAWRLWDPKVQPFCCPSVDAKLD